VDSYGETSRCGRLQTLTSAQAGGADDLPTLLAMHKPRIAVDENGG
jgi:hypothetical protein